MGKDPNIPDLPLGMKPITGNDIFPPRPPSPTPTPPVLENALDAELPVDPPSQTPLLLRSIPHYFIDDDDFPPDTTESSQQPSQDPGFSKYSTELSDEGEDDEETEDQNRGETKEQAQCEPNLEEFMDFEFLKQG